MDFCHIVLFVPCTYYGVSDVYYHAEDTKNVQFIANL